MKRWGILTILAVVLLIGWWAIRPANSNEPKYQGKTLSEWLKKYEADGHADRRADYNRAIREIGTNGIPVLLNLLTTKELPGATGVQWVAASLGKRDFHHFDAEYKYRLASLGFEVLGEEGKSAAPALIKLANTGAANQKARTYALWCLEETKPEKAVLLPVLTRLTNDTNSEVAAFAATRLSVLSPKDTDKADKKGPPPR